MKSCYLMGASGTGKTTLAKHVAKAFGLSPLPSAARSVMADWGLTDAEIPDLIADKSRYHEFQKEVFDRQAKMERLARLGGGFVTDRGLDHLIFTALYGIKAEDVMNSHEFQVYLDTFWRFTSVVFFVRPTWQVYLKAKEDGDRPLFINWDAMQRFDGAMKFILETHGIPYVVIDVPGLQDRIDLVNFHLIAAGLKLKEIPCS